MATSKRGQKSETEADELKEAMNHLDEVSARITRLMTARNATETPPPTTAETTREEVGQ